MMGTRATAPRVSVVLAVYNGERFLHHTMRSVLSQSFADFEFIVVNDGSTDSSRDIALSYGDPRVRLLDNPRNLGLARSLNLGIQAAEGEFVARIDADDVAAPTRFARQIAFFARHPGVALAGSWYRELDARGRRSGRVTLPTEHEALRWSLMFHCPFVHSAMMWRRVPVTEAVGLYDTDFQYALDWEYWTRIASRFRVANTRAALIDYRVGPHSMSAKHPRVGTESEAARIASVRAVFGPAESEVWLAEMAGLIRLAGGWRDLPVAENVRPTVDAMQRLHAAFAARLGLDGAELQAQRRWFGAWIGQRIISAARRAHRAGDMALGKLLYREARRANPGLPVNALHARYLLARIVGAVGGVAPRPRSRAGAE